MYIVNYYNYVVKGMSKEPDMESFRKRILAEMTFNYSGVLEQNFEVAKQYVRLAKNGDVDVLSKERLTGQEKILLYLLGKLYAKEASLATTEEVGNNELMKNLSIPMGSLLPWLKSLRDESRISETEKDNHAYHSLPISQVEMVLKEITKKVQGGAYVREEAPLKTVLPSLPESLAEFVKLKGNVSKHGVLVVIFGYWLVHKKKQNSFNSKDIMKCYYETLMHKSSNTSQYMNAAQSEGYFKRLDEKKDDHVAWTITRTGEMYVEAEGWKVVR